LDCLTPKTYGLTPRNPSCAAQYPRYWIRKVDGGHLGKWRGVRIAHTSDDVITQLRDPHAPTIEFRHADKCCYSVAGALLFWGPLLQHYVPFANCTLSFYILHFYERINDDDDDIHVVVVMLLFMLCCGSCYWYVNLLTTRANYLLYFQHILMIINYFMNIILVGK